MEKQKHLSFNFHPSERLEKIILYGPFALAGLMFIACLYVELTHIGLSRETRNSIYSISGSITFYFSILLNILYGRKYGIGWIRSALYSLASFLLVFSCVSQLWSKLDVVLFGFGSVASFRSTLLLPLLCFFLSRFDKRSTLTICDYLTPYYFFQHGITTHACWICGCCEGRPMSWGIIDPDTGLYTFPAQPYAILLSLAVALWGLIYARKQKHSTHGEVFGNSLIAYGCFRYVMEFFTDDPRVIGALSLYSIYSLLLALLGSVILHIGKRSSNNYINFQSNQHNTEDLL